MTQEQIDEKLFYLAQLLDERAALIINDALHEYAGKTIGSDQSIALQIARIFGQ